MNDPQKIAEAAAEAIYARDRCAKMMGIEMVEVGPGHARFSMRVRPDMLNGYDTCHGGMTFTLADAAFAYACNSYNRLSVAQSCEIVFPAPAREGDVLTATAEERYMKGRTGVYDITVTNQDGEVVALFRGLSRMVKGEAVPGLEEKQ